jgi:sulfur carrier protein ThiS
MVFITVKLPSGEDKTIEVTKEMTLREILHAVGCQTEGVTVYNNGDTPMPSLDWTMVDYNNWYVEKNYIPSLYVKIE